MFIKLLSILGIVLYANIGFATAPQIPDPYSVLELGDELKPLNAQVKPTAAQSVSDEFSQFCATEQEKCEKLAEYKAIREFAESLFNANGAMHMPGHHATYVSFSTIEPWISNMAENNTAGMAATYSDRVLIVSYELLAQVLNVRSQRTVTAAQISEYVENAKSQKKTYKLYQLLKQFAGEKLGIMPPEVDQLDQWFLENNNGGAAHMHAATPKLKGEIKVVHDLVEAKAGRNISEEFESFVERNVKLIERAQLFSNLEKFVMRQGNGQTLTTLMPPMAFENLQVFENGCMMPRQILTEGFDFVRFLAEAKMQSLQAMFSNITADTRLRTYGKFVLCSQGSGVEMYQGNQQLQDRLYTESQVEFRDGLIFQANRPLTTFDTTWAMDHNGNMRIFPLTPGVIMGCNHSMFFQKDYVGVPIACGGHIELVAGKITKINNGSGHYNPSFLNLVMAVAHLHEKGVIAEGIKFDGIYTGTATTANFGLAEVLNIARSIEFA